MGANHMPLYPRTREFIVKIDIGNEEHDRLKRHAERLSTSQKDILKTALHDRLNKLDEQELFALQVKNARKKQGTRIGEVPMVRAPDSGAPTTPPRFGAGGFELPSLPGGLRSIAEPPEEKMPTKFAASISSWLKFIAEAEGVTGRQIKLTQVEIDLKERGATEKQIEAVMTVIHEKLAARDTLKPVKIERAPEDVPISGDVD